MKKLLTCTAGLVLAAVASSSALADGRTAARNLFSNLARARASLSINEATAMVGPTLVRGLYTLSNQQGRFVGFTNEAGTLFGDSRGFNVVANGAQPRQLALDEISDLRGEVVAAIDYDKLLKITYGDGGGRRLVLFSAVDCPFCKGFEDNMRKHGAGLNSTIYVVPSSLRKIDQGGFQQWQAVSRIWCASDAGAAWQEFWATRALPVAGPQPCRFADPRIAEMADQHLKDILQAVGVRVVGLPQMVREDGAIIANKAEMNSAYIAATFGPAGGTWPVGGKSLRWLQAAADDSFSMQPVGGHGTSQQQPAHSQVGINQVLKKLLLLK